MKEYYVVSIDEEFEKSQVKGFTRTRRGKLERVNPFSREGDKPAIPNDIWKFPEQKGKELERVFKKRDLDIDYEKKTEANTESARQREKQNKKSEQQSMVYHNGHTIEPYFYNGYWHARVYKQKDALIGDYKTKEEAIEDAKSSIDSGYDHTLESYK